MRLLRKLARTFFCIALTLSLYFLNLELTYGMLEMGGASTQIANLENHGDMMVIKHESNRVPPTSDMRAHFML